MENAGALMQLLQTFGGWGVSVILGWWLIGMWRQMRQRESDLIANFQSREDAKDERIFLLLDKTNQTLNEISALKEAQRETVHAFERSGSWKVPG